ncbi:hypothetical protein YC2023_039450 [Brassica napus]
MRDVNPISTSLELSNISYVSRVTRFHPCVTYPCIFNTCRSIHRLTRLVSCDRIGCKVSSGPGDSQLLFKLIYFKKARNNSKGDILFGLEMLMIDEEVKSLVTITARIRNEVKRRMSCIEDEGSIYRS